MKGKSMKKAEDKTVAMRAEYRRDQLDKGVRGKHFAQFQKGSNLVLLKPELSKLFPTDAAVNAALASFAEGMRVVDDEKARRKAASRPVAA
jgi:hypothetical protein